MESPRVFISYATADLAVAEELAEFLSASGIESWYAKNSIPGAAEWEREIRRAIDSRNWMVLLVSESATKSHWVGSEVQQFVNRHQALDEDARTGRILSLCLDSAQPSDLYLPLNRVQHINYAPSQRSDARPRILSALRGDAVGPRNEAPRAASICSFQARYLFGFRFDSTRLGDIEAQLTSDSFDTSRGRAVKIWSITGKDPNGDINIDPLYSHHFHHDVTALLFGTAGRDGRWFRVDHVLSNTWFKDLTCTWEQRNARIDVPVRLIEGTRVELFLSTLGVGVLSMSLDITPREMQIDSLVDLNVRIAQFGRRAGRFDLRHDDPRDDRQRWECIPENARWNMKFAQVDDPLELRLQLAGGTFKLVELVDRLLQPMARAGAPVAAIHDNLYAYSVLGLSNDVDFDSRADRETWCSWLARLSQVERPTYPDCKPDGIPVPEAVLNRRHWAAVGQRGAVHLVVDETAGDESRSWVGQALATFARDCYFVPYLLALMHKLAIERLLADVRSLGESSTADVEARLGKLRDDVRRLGTRTSFAQISTREGLDRYYQLVQRGLDIPASWQLLQHAVN